jgi:tRNA pseudouridine32 synthase/23S rRNA pseudouridine746 synthase
MYDPRMYNPKAILFQDRRFVVIDKPAGLPCHPGAGGGPSVEDWFPDLSRRKDGPWLAHRLDADTAGCLVVALRKAPLIAAQAAFASGLARKVYWAVVRGAPPAEHGTVAVNLVRREARGQWHIAVDPAGHPAGHPPAGHPAGGHPAGGHPAGRVAITDWRVLGHTAGLSWLELRPRTGRTHQIRVHCAHLGCPILGDARYGTDEPGTLHLLARSIEIPLDPPLLAVAEPPPAQRAALLRCGWPMR